MNGMFIMLKVHFRLIMICLVIGSLAGCSTGPRGISSSAEINASLQEAAPSKTAQSHKAPELPPSLAADLVAESGTNPLAVEEARFDVAAEKVPAREFFMSLVEGTPYNMVVHPEVSGTVTLSLKNVTVPEVMEVVRSVFGYSYRQNRTGFQVLASGLQSRIFYVNYLNLKRTGISQTRVSSGQVSEVDGDSDSDENNDSGSRVVSGSQVDTETFSDFWAELQTALTMIVGTGKGRQVVVQPQANLVVVRALANELDEVASYLEAVQGNVQRQVILEAKIIEVTLSDGYQTGINWAALGEPGTGKSVVVGQTGGGTAISNGVSSSAGNTGTLNPLNLTLTEGLDNAAFGGVFSAAVNLKDFTAFIELLKSQGNVQILSSPRVSTVNNQKAVIKVGSDEFFVTDISSDTTTGTTTTTTPDIELTPFFSGIALDVTPQIDPDENVTLHIHPTISEVVDQQKEITVAGQSQVIPLAFSTVRESDSIVRARSGQVVVIGGLMKNSETENEASVPLLGDLPGVGRLFRHNKEVSTKTELVILLRPIVVNSDQQWRRSVEQTQKRLRNLNGNFSSPW